MNQASLHTAPPDTEGNKTVISVKNVSKKFCKNLKRSMAYGITDLCKNIVGMQLDSTLLKKGEFWALDNISFSLCRGETLGLIGVNGSGKTTLLRLLAGIFPPDGGEIMIKGRVGALIALGAGFHPHMTGRENVYLNGSILGLRRSQIEKQFDEIVAFAEIENFIDAPVATYSSGMRVRLGFSIAMAIKPDVLLIDEVLAVGDLGFKAKCLNAINELMKDTAVIFVSHSMQFISRICTQIIVLDKGCIAHYGNDINEGIDHYYSLFSISEKKVSGSGKAAVTGVQLSNGGESAGGNGMLVMDYGNDLFCEMRVSIDPSVKKPAIRVMIFDQKMHPVADCYTEHSGFEINRAAAPAKIKLACKKIQFNAGIYSVSIMVVDLLSNAEILFRNDNIASFQVRHRFRSWSSILLPGEWEQEKE